MVVLVDFRLTERAVQIRGVHSLRVFVSSEEPVVNLLLQQDYIGASFKRLDAM